MNGMWNSSTSLLRQIHWLENFGTTKGGDIGQYHATVIPHGAIDTSNGPLAGSTFVRGCECDWSGVCLKAKYNNPSQIQDVDPKLTPHHFSSLITKTNFENTVASQQVVDEINCTAQRAVSEHEERRSCKLSPISDRLKFKWQPRTCELPAFDAQAFCKILGNRQIVSIGDSITAQIESSIRAQIIAGGGDCWRNLIFIRNNWLVVTG
jgi:hypothetical protein